MFPDPSSTNPCGPEFVTFSGYSSNSPVFGSSRPILFAICSVNHNDPSAPTAGSCGCAPLVGTAHSLIVTFSSCALPVSLAPGSLFGLLILLLVAARETAKPAITPASAKLCTTTAILENPAG